MELSDLVVPGARDQGEPVVFVVCCGLKRPLNALNDSYRIKMASSDPKYAIINSLMNFIEVPIYFCFRIKIAPVQKY
jgi:hypothetical protein